jgi:hypothetical protein
MQSLHRMSRGNCGAATTGSVIPAPITLLDIDLEH